MLYAGQVTTTAGLMLRTSNAIARSGGYHVLWDPATTVSVVDGASGQWAKITETTRTRWRGAAAAGAGTGFRNRHWSSAAADAKQVPIAFKANPAAAAAIQSEPVIVRQAVVRSAVW
jgi:hypothetical protein